MNLTRKSFVTWLLILIALPWPLDYWLAAKRARRDARYDELVFRYECNYRSQCLADFDGDGEFARFLTSGGPRSFLTIREGDREIFQTPYDLTDNTLRTHVAVSDHTGSPHLLIYDGINFKPSLKAAFAYNGVRLVEVSPTRLERDILDAMAAHDDTGGWNERAIRDLFRIARFLIYYALLTVLAGLMLLWRRGATTDKYGRTRGVE